MSLPDLSLLPVLWLAAMNLIDFFLMGWDKSCARRGRRRVPEKMLFLPAVLGGAAGGWAGMYLFRHKTRHWYFVLGMPLLLACHIGLGLWLSGLVDRLPDLL